MITRAPRPDSNFYILDKSISEDARLSWGARGLLIFLLGKPDNWDVSITHLKDQTSHCAKPTGRDGLYGLLEELMLAGYVIRLQQRTDSGSFSTGTYLVTEIPHPSNPVTVKPVSATATLISTDLDQGLKELTNSCQQADEVPYDEIFNAYEKALPQKPKVRIRDEARRKAVRSMWNRDKKYQKVEFWNNYFGVVSDSRFLSENKTLAFDWLLKPANFKKVAEGNYS